MFVEYFYWHYIESPLWLIRFFITVQQALAQYFSVKVMLRTLVAPWRKDQVRYGAGGISGIVMVFAWNMISRGIGFIVRTSVVSVWVIMAVVVLLFGIVFFIAFLLWPLLSLFAVSLGLGLMLYSV